MKKICLFLSGVLLVSHLLFAAELLSPEASKAYLEEVEQKEDAYFARYDIKKDLDFYMSVPDLETAFGVYIQLSDPFYNEKTKKLEELMEEAARKEPEVLLKLMLYRNERYEFVNDKIVDIFSVHNKDYLNTVILFTENKPMLQAYAKYKLADNYDAFFDLWDLALTKDSYHYKDLCKNKFDFYFGQQGRKANSAFEALNRASDQVVNAFNYGILSDYFRNISDKSYLGQYIASSGKLASRAKSRLADIEENERQYQERLEIEKRKREKEAYERKLEQERIEKEKERKRLEAEELERERIAKEKRDKFWAKVKMFLLFVFVVCVVFYVKYLKKEAARIEEEEKIRLANEEEERIKRQKAKEEQKKAKELKIQELDKFISKNYSDFEDMPITKLLSKIRHFSDVRKKKSEAENFKSEFELFGEVCKDADSFEETVFNLYKKGCHSYEVSQDASVLTAESRYCYISLYATSPINIMICQNKQNPKEQLTWKREV